MIPSPSVNALVGVDDMALVLLASLAAMGITFTAADGIAATSEWIVDKFEDWVNSTGQSLSEVWSSIRYGITQSGGFAVNYAGLRNIGFFANDLITDFNISSNSQVSTNQPASVYLGGNYYPIYLGQPSGFSDAMENALRPFTLPEGNFTYTGGSLYITYHPDFIYNLQPNGFNGITNNSRDIYFCFICYYNGVYNFGYYCTYQPYTARGVNLLSQDRVTPAAWSAWLNFVDHCILPPVTDGIDINAGTLDVPQVGDYDDDDGILIDGIGSWGDTLQDIWDKISGWSIPDQPVPAISYEYAASDELAGELVNEGELTTENSPLILWPGGSFSYNFSFSSIWHYVTDWVSSMSAGLALTGSIMFSLPFVGVWYAVLVLIIVLSLWRLLKHA